MYLVNNAFKMLKHSLRERIDFPEENAQKFDKYLDKKISKFGK